MSQWYEACETFSKLAGKKPSYRDFLCRYCGPEFEGSRSQIVSFTKKLKEYKEGKLKPTEVKRRTQPRYPAVEEKLIKYIECLDNTYKREKYSFVTLKERAKKYAEQLGIQDFEASYSWISNTLRRAGMVEIKLHGGANELTPEELAICDDEIDELETINDEAVQNDTFSYMEAKAVIHKLLRSSSALRVSESDNIHLHRYLRSLTAANAARSR